MASPRFLQFPLCSVSAAVALGWLATTVSGRADLYWAATVNGSAATAGSGTWNNTTANWTAISGGIGNTPWTANNTAHFQGTGGGTVTTGADLAVAAIQFDATAATFGINNGFNFTLNGAGMSNGSGKSQTFTNNGTMSFNNSATVVNTTGGSTTTLTNNGDLTFNGSSSAGAALLMNNGNLYYNGTSGGGTINNAGALDISNHSSSTTTVTSLITGGQAILGSNLLSTSALTLNDNGSLAFTLGTNSGKISDTGLFTSSGGPATTTVDLFAGAGLTGGRYNLITFATGAGVSTSDFTLGSSIPGYSATFGTDANDVYVNLTPVPEVSSAFLPMAGALGLLAFRRRRAPISVEVAV